MKLFSSSQNGRSMIEMLGVLAIVGVLSIGGIAGYSKAMRSYKINKLIEEHGIVLNSLLEYSSALKRDAKNSSNENRLYLAPFTESMGILPKSWNRKGNYLYDSTGRRLLVYTRGLTLTYLPYITSTTSRAKPTLEDMLLCQRMLRDITLQFAPVIEQAYIWQGGDGDESSFKLGVGDNFCNQNKKCLHSLDMSTIIDGCSFCLEDYSCMIAMDIPL